MARGMTIELLSNPLAAQRADLASLAERARLRRLAPRTGVDFASNDYLGLADSPRLRHAVATALGEGVPVGSGGSRLLRGNHPEHEALEAEAAAFFGAEAALYFSTGFAANAALLATLPQRGDLVVHDALVHASAHDGMRLARAPDTGGMGLVDQQHRAVAIGDGGEIGEAHATGIWGAGGRGLSAGLEGRPNVVTLHTCGKALGCEGALVCGPAVVRECLVNRGRGFIFSTAPSPLMARAVREALRIVADEPERRDRLAALIAGAEVALAPHGVTATGSQILPLIVGEDAATMRLAAAVQAAGFDVRGIRPPTVPAGTARLRLSLTLNVEADDVRALADVLKEARA